MKHSNTQRLLLPLLFSMFSTTVFAQAPDAGALRQQIEQERTFSLPGIDIPAQTVQPTPPAAPTDLAVTVNLFRFSGNTLLSSDHLSQALAPFLNRPLGFQDLLAAADAVASTYREAGWIVRAYLPEQDISEGEVLLNVIEAHFGGVDFEGVPGKRVLAAEVEQYFLAQQAVGAPLSANALDRALLIVDDLPGVSVAGTLAQGQSVGKTRLILLSSDEPAFYGDIGLDNSGARSTGSTRLSGNLRLNSPGGYGELVSLNLLHSRGLSYGRAALMVPAGHSGLRAGVNASVLEYKVVDGPKANVDAKIRGRSSSVGLDLTYPLIRAREHNLYLAAGAEHKRFYSRDISQVSADYSSNGWRVAFQGNRFDKFMGGGVSTMSIQLNRGQLTSLKAHTQRATLPRQFTKVTYSLARQQNLMANHTLGLSLYGQHSNKPLDSSERIYIGGPGSVRAYPVSELGGDKGQLLTLEWRWRASPTVLLTTFADAGRVVRLAQPSAPRESHVLRGYGVSLAWQAPHRITTQVTWSRRAGRNPQPTLTGTDSDGTRKLNRIWLSANMAF